MTMHYGDAKVVGAGGAVLLYVEEPSSTPPPPNIPLAPPSPPPIASGGAGHAAELIHRATTLDDASNDDNGLSTNSSDGAIYGESSGEATNHIYTTFWNISASMKYEFLIDIYIELRTNTADAVARLAQKYYPGAVAWARHSVRMYAEACRMVIQGTTYVGYTASRNERLDPAIVWSYIESTFDEFSAATVSFYDMFHMWMAGFMGVSDVYDTRTVRFLCGNSRVPNHLLRESLKITSAVASFAQFPSRATGASIGCDSNRANCTDADTPYEIDTELVLNPVCALTDTIVHPQLPTLSAYQNVFLEILENVELSEDMTIHEGVEEVMAAIDKVNIPSTSGITLVRILKSIMSQVTTFIVHMFNCMSERFGKTSGNGVDDCDALLNDLSYPTETINLYVILTYEAQIKLCNFFGSASGIFWSWVYYATDYDPSLYSTAQIMPRDWTERALLPRTMCIGLEHSRCVAQGMGNATLPGAHFFRWMSTDDTEYVVHACERDGWCQCAWIIPADVFERGRERTEDHLVFHRDRMTGRKINATPDQATHYGFAGFPNDTVRYYQTSAHGKHITENGYAPVDDRANVALSYWAPFPYWLFEEGACVSTCDLITSSDKCSNGLSIVTVDTIAGASPNMLRMGCAHSTKHGCGSDLHHVQSYPLEAATSTLLVAYSSVTQRAVIAMNLTVSHLLVHWINLLRATVDGDSVDPVDAVSSTLSDVVEVSLFPLLFGLYDTAETMLLYTRDCTVALVEWIRALVIVCMPDGSGRFYEFQKDMMGFVSLLENMLSILGSELLSMLNDGFEMFYYLIAAIVESIRGESSERDLQLAGRAAANVILDWGGALMQFLYHLVFDSPFGKVIMETIDGVCDAVRWVQNAFHTYKEAICDVVEYEFLPTNIHLKSSTERIKVLGAHINIPSYRLSLSTHSISFLMSFANLEKSLNCHCPSPHAMARDPEKYKSSEYDDCYAETSCHAPRGDADDLFRPMEASTCRVDKPEHIEEIYNNDVLPAYDAHTEWEKVCSMCWATSDAQCMETRTGDGDGGYRGRPFDKYGHRMSSTNDAYQACSRLRTKQECEAKIVNEFDMHLCVWESDFYTSNVDDSSTGVCVGRRTTKNEMFGQPCLCDKCAGGVYCGASGYCQCGTLPYMMLGMECRPYFEKTIRDNVTVFDRVEGAPGIGCGECPADGVRSLASSGANRDSMCYVRQASACGRYARANSSGEGTQSISECLASLPILGPYLCATHCSPSTLNEDNLLFRAAPVDLATASNLDLRENARLDPDEIPIAALCTCDLNLLAVIAEAIEWGDDVDVGYDETKRIAWREDDATGDAKRRALRSLARESNTSVSPDFPSATAIAERRRAHRAGTRCLAAEDCASALALCHDASATVSRAASATLCNSCPRPAFLVSEAPRSCDTEVELCVCGVSRADSRLPVRPPPGNDDDEEKLLALMSDAALWTGDSICDRLMRELVHRVPAVRMVDLSVMERITARECFHDRHAARRWAEALDLPTLPVDLFYNPHRPYDIAFMLLRGVYVRHMVLDDPRNVTLAIRTYDRYGVDADLFDRVYTAVTDPFAELYKVFRASISNATGDIFASSPILDKTLRGVARALNTSKNVVRVVANDLERADSVGRVIRAGPHIAADVYTLAKRFASIVASYKVVKDERYEMFYDAHYRHLAKDTMKFTTSIQKRLRESLEPPIVASSSSTRHAIDESSTRSNSARYASETSGRSLLAESSSRTEHCSIYDQLRSAVGDVADATFRYYAFVNNMSDLAYNHTFQSSLCDMLHAARFIDPSSTDVTLHAVCKSDTNRVKRQAEIRSPYAIAVQNYENARHAFGDLIRYVGDMEHDITQTHVRKVDGNGGATEVVIRSIEEILRTIGFDFDFDRDVTTIIVNDVFARDQNETRVATIENISFYSVDYIGVVYAEDNAIGLRSERFGVNGAVYFRLNDVFSRVGNWPLTTYDAVAWNRWYNEWSRNKFVRGKGLSTILLRESNRYVDFDLYDYRVAQPNASYWSANVAADGRFPAAFFMAACEIREPANEEVRTDVNAWCLNDTLRTSHFGPTQLLKWSGRGYGDGDEWRWYKLPVRFSTHRFDTDRMRKLALLESGEDYPEPPYRLYAEVEAEYSHEALSRTARDVEIFSLILRYDMYDRDFYDDADLRAKAYICLCEKLYLDDSVSCTKDRSCIAPRVSFFDSRVRFVYDNGGWWDCRDASQYACIPMYGLFTKTIATFDSSDRTTSKLARGAARGVDGTCEELGLVECSRRDYDWPIVPTFMVRALIGTCAIFVIKFTIGDTSMTYVGYAIVIFAVVHGSLSLSYQWQLDCYPSLPTCLMDDVAADVETFFAPEHIAWPHAWAERDSNNGRLRNNVRCTEHPYGFVDGFRNAAYMWRKHAPDSLDEFCNARVSKWLCEALRTYTRYYDNLEEEDFDRADACHYRTILNYAPAAMLTIVVLYVAAYLFYFGLKLTSVWIGTNAAVIPFFRHTVTSMEIRLHIGTVEEAIDVLEARNHDASIKKTQAAIE